jgi:hypothetical protein
MRTWLLRARDAAVPLRAALGRPAFGGLQRESGHRLREAGVGDKLDVAQAGSRSVARAITGYQGDDSRKHAGQRGGCGSHGAPPSVGAA